ncbi:thermonuclease family protein [Candidatus Shapirobacteria bacterium]|nr:thermonuclease family protein [Candidatus Shapirobacteria bacterium]
MVKLIMKLVVVGLMAIVVMMGGWIVKIKKDVPEKMYTVNRVIDGDTIVIDNNQEIRLANIDAPEKGRCGFEEAKVEMEKLVLNKKIKIEGSVNDRFGRLLTTVWIDGKMVNEEIVRTGWVRYDSQGENKYIQNIDDEVEGKRMGIYGKCREETNRENPECRIKGNNREGTNDHIYVLPGCKNYAITKIARDMGDEWFCTEKEASESGYVKALNCE